jgi:hypothetical protein
MCRSSRLIADLGWWVHERAGRSTLRVTFLDVGQGDALQRVNEYYRPMIDAECYPLAFIWHSDLWTTIRLVHGRRHSKIK